MKYRFFLFLFFFSYVVDSFGQTLEYHNSSEIFLKLKKLNVLGSVLYIAAHPDDENNGLLPWLAKEKLYRTGYLSLTRGDGGQNLIGPEQGIELGLIRTQELLAARKVDGAEQFFSTAYEFGFSKSADESLKIWGHDKILSDVVWVIRQYQPDVIITRFPGDKRAGHGHHAASSILANEAFTAAADPNKFPEQFKYGVKPWQAKRILWNTFNFGGNNTTSDDQLKIDVGGYNPLLGKSYGELGGEARSMHKSQGEGRPRRKGSILEFFSTTGGEAPKVGLMDGIDQSWSRLSGKNKIQEMISSIISTFNLDHPESTLPELVSVYNAINLLPRSNWKTLKLKETQDIIEACAGIFADATSSTPSVVQGENLPVTIFMNNRKSPSATLKHISLGSFDSSLNSSLGSNTNILFNTTIHISNDKKISQPYWLEFPQKEGSFDVRDQTLIGRSENAPAYMVKYVVNVYGTDFTIERPVMFKIVDPVKGELYEPLIILPKAEVNYLHSNYISVNGKSVNSTIHFHFNEKTPKSYEVIIGENPGLITTSGIKEETDKKDFTIPVAYTPKVKSIPGNLKVISAVKSEGIIYNQYRRVISYDHIPVITYFAKAESDIVNVDLKKSGNNIGYIIGAGDKVPEELEQMGYKVSYLNESSLTDDNLKNFDAIIVGIRAYNIYEYLTDKNETLNRYVQNGGNLIVQYLKSNFIGDKKIAAGPYPFSINGGSRVTEENAKVHFLLPEHPVLNYPNKITEKDFDGWVQERSTYQADKSDKHFEKPLGMSDTGEQESDGSVLIAKYGKGNFVYLSLVLFRELPAGNPGAFRIMANCIALPKN